MKVEFYRHSLEEEDIAAAARALRSVFLTAGPETAEFERRFAEYAGLDHAVGLTSCTAALHLALLALGIGPGDEVITTPLTFIASSTAVIHTGAEPVWVDVEPETGLLDPARVEAAITPRTKAILPVHLYGTLADMRALRALADRRGLKIVEDCAHCVEGERDGVRPGQLGDVAAYSFYATKNLTCGEGGAAACCDPGLAARIRRLRQHGMSKEAADRYSGRYAHWDMVELGWKYNMFDVQAALLLGQLPRLEEQWRRREELGRRYDAAFGALPGVARPAPRGKSARHLYTIWVDPDRRDEVLRRLQDEGVGVAVNYRAIHTLAYFRERYGYAPDRFPHAYRIGASTISLPLYPRLSDAEADFVIAAVAKAAR